jgi:hypothetical protein
VILIEDIDEFTKGSRQVLLYTLLDLMHRQDVYYVVRAAAFHCSLLTAHSCWLVTISNLIFPPPPPPPSLYCFLATIYSPLGGRFVSSHRYHLVAGEESHFQTERPVRLSPTQECPRSQRGTVAGDY